MLMNSEDEAFLKKREKMIKTWPFVGVAIIIMFLGLAMHFFISVPRMINPIQVFSELNSGTIPETSLVIMTAMVPILNLTIIVMMVVFVLLAWKFFSHEKRYHKIIANLSGEAGRDRM
jgi:uncharacterized membrane protein